MSGTRIPPDPLADGIAAYGLRLRQGATSASAAVEAYLLRIEAFDGALGAYACVDADGAREAAALIDARRAEGEDLGPLMGVPVALKDNIAVAGLPLGGGSTLDLDDLCGPEGSFVRRLRAAGCIILGKANTCELAIGSAGLNYQRGTPRNPWDTGVKRVPGGSSSGSAVAMAAALCGFAVGTDTGGSVRTPAAFCGVVGLKFGAAPWQMDGILPMSRSLDSLGILARSVGDAELVASTLLGQPASVAPPLHALRLARPTGFGHGMSSEVRLALDAAWQRLEQAGARFVDIDEPALDACGALFHTISGPELPAEFAPEHLPDLLRRVNPNVAQRLRRGLDVPAADYLHAVRQRTQLEHAGAQLFDHWDALLGPTKLVTAPPCPASYEAEADDALAALCAGPTRAANVMRLPALSLPLPRTGAALPIGLQLLGAPGDGLPMLALARRIEAVLGPPATPPLDAFFHPAATPGATVP